MKITVLTGSPRRAGTSALLVDEFIAGAKKNGHEISRFDCAFMNIVPCNNCDFCINNDGKCVHDDDMVKIENAVRQADMVVFASPIYYFGMTSYIKHAIDRFYYFNDALLASKKKAILLTTAGDNDGWALDAICTHFSAICRYLGWEDVARVTACGVYTREDIEKTDYPRRARVLGESIK